jgi:hypothetical protein
MWQTDGNGSGYQSFSRTKGNIGMNLEESIKRFGLSNIEVKHTESYMEKAEKTKVMYCPLIDDCTGEFYDFEGECQLCKSREGDQFSGGLA